MVRSHLFFEYMAATYDSHAYWNLYNHCPSVFEDGLHYSQTKLRDLMGAVLMSRVNWDHRYFKVCDHQNAGALTHTYCCCLNRAYITRPNMEVSARRPNRGWFDLENLPGNAVVFALKGGISWTCTAVTQNSKGNIDAYYMTFEPNASKKSRQSILPKRNMENHYHCCGIWQKTLLWFLRLGGWFPCGFNQPLQCNFGDAPKKNTCFRLALLSGLLLGMARPKDKTNPS